MFWKFARIGERLSPYVSICCVIMAVGPPLSPRVLYELSDIGGWYHRLSRSFRRGSGSGDGKLFLTWRNNCWLRGREEGFFFFFLLSHGAFFSPSNSFVIMALGKGARGIGSDTFFYILHHIPGLYASAYRRREKITQQCQATGRRGKVRVRVERGGIT